MLFWGKKYFFIRQSIWVKINVLNPDFDHMIGLANGFCDQNPNDQKWTGLVFIGIGKSEYLAIAP